MLGERVEAGIDRDYLTTQAGDEPFSRVTDTRVAARNVPAVDRGKPDGEGYRQLHTRVFL